MSCVWSGGRRRVACSKTEYEPFLSQKYKRCNRWFWPGINPSTKILKARPFCFFFLNLGVYPHKRGFHFIHRCAINSGGGERAAPINDVVSNISKHTCIRTALSFTVAYTLFIIRSRSAIVTAINKKHRCLHWSNGCAGLR